jgi:hypothetical protein
VCSDSRPTRRVVCIVLVHHIFPILLRGSIMAVSHDNVSDGVFQYPVVISVVVKKPLLAEHSITEPPILHKAVFDIHPQAAKHDRNEPFKR